MMYMKRATIIAATREAKYVIPEESYIVVYNAEGFWYWAIFTGNNIALSQLLGMNIFWQKKTDEKSS